MANKFIVSIDSGIKSSSDENFKKKLQDANVAWWHWLSNTWLIKDSLGKFTPSELGTLIKQCYPEANYLVTKVKNEGWHGYGPSSDTEKERNMFNWIHENWTPE